MVTDAKVMLWGRLIGAVTWLERKETAVFQYNPEFTGSGIELSPLMMPLSQYPYEFPGLPRNTFKGLPGMLADSLPDKFGNAIIDAWLASQGRSANSFHPVERLCYVGNRGMGALEFEPTIQVPHTERDVLNMEHLVHLANQILDKRRSLGGSFTGVDDTRALEQILRVGTSAGGARAKAILAWHPQTNEFRSGQLPTPEGFEQWILKFDGVTYNRDKELADPLGYGKVEYAYHLMAKAAGIEMTHCRLHEEGGRHHFMTKRFDRTDDGGKIHMQSLGGIAHFDYNQPASYSYEQAISVMKKLGLPQGDLEQQVLRAFFNVMARNQDDHVKNIAFLMDKTGRWRLSPAYDVTYAYDPHGDWTSRHQMSVNGKRDQFERSDLIQLGAFADIKPTRCAEMLERVTTAIAEWPDFAEQAGVDESRVEIIRQTHRDL